MNLQFMRANGASDAALKAIGSRLLKGLPTDTPDIEPLMAQAIIRHQSSESAININ
jgi:hypothetical protein